MAISIPLPPVDCPLKLLNTIGTSSFPKYEVIEFFKQNHDGQTNVVRQEKKASSRPHGLKSMWTKTQRTEKDVSHEDAFPPSKITQFH